MAKREKPVEEAVAPDEQRQMSIEKLTKSIIGELNKDAESKVAWNLATDFDNPTDVREFISTGSTLLDYLITNRRDGGIPVGKLTEICGEEATGKSLIIAHLIAETQRKGGIAALLDSENAFNPGFAKQIGVDVSKLIYCQPGTIEEVGETIQKIIINVRTKAPDRLCFIAWDSVAGTPPKAEIEGTFDPNERMGLMAKTISTMMRKLTQVWGKERIAMVFANQMRMKLGVTYGDPMYTPGGKAIPFHASVRIKLTRSTVETDTDEKDEARGKVQAVNTKAKVIKNRLGPPLRKCDFKISFATGVLDEESWFDYLHSVGDVEKAAGWCYILSFKHPEEKRNELVRPDGKPGRGFRFRESQWKQELTACPALRSHALSLLEEHLVVRYGEAPQDQEVDPESLMDAESFVETVVGRPEAGAP